MVVLCDAKHNQKLKYLIFKKRKGALHYLEIALAFWISKYLDFLLCFASHKINFWECPTMRRTYHKNLRNIYLTRLGD